MPTARIASIAGPIDLYYEETGQGFPLIWCHEYGGDYRSWEQLVAEFLTSVESGRYGTWKGAAR